MSSDLAKGTKTVKADGGNMAAIKGSEFSRCSGDEPGTAGGVVSSTNMKEATWLLYSFDVKMDGKNACRLTDSMKMNHGNTVCMRGVGGIPVTVSEIHEDLCKAMCEHENAAQKGEKRSSNKLEKDCQASGKFGPKVLFRTSYNSPTGTMTKKTRPDAVLASKPPPAPPERCFDFKLCGDYLRDDQAIRQAGITSTGKPPVVIDCPSCGCCTCP
jgi:hypothetical protein